MKKIYLFLLVCLCYSVNGQLLVSTPDFPKETDANVVITLDASKGNQGLVSYNPNDVYVHLGAITNLSTSSSDWKYVLFTWATTNPAAKAVSLGNNKWTYTLTGADARAYFGITNPAEHILKIAILFRNGAGTSVQRNTDGSDMYVPFYDATIQAKISRPFRQPTYNPTVEPITKNIGDTILLEGKSNTAGTLKLFFNGAQLATSATTSVSSIATVTNGGTQRIIAEAQSGGAIKRDTLDFFVTGNVNVAALPAGVTDGINYGSNNTSATLVLFAPGKSTVTVLGDFNGWQQQTAYQMNRTPDGNRFWIELNGLTSGTEYAYQYLIDGSLKVADYNAEKVLDPANDPFITAATYPNLKPYPTGLTTGIVSVLQTAKPQYNWSSNNFTRPDKRNLMIYELLVRDFVEKHDWKTLTDTLAYLQRMGINTIHVMPFNEFEGNIGWGYNPSFFLAPDKYYGPENDLRRFIDSAHAKGMAIVMDMVMNHAYGQSPMVQMYFDGTNPTANSPWFNTVAPHSWLTFGYDFNHEAQATKDYTSKVIRHWLTKYRIDGFRWDFTKGFSQRIAPNDAASQAYDPSRIAILKRIYDTMQSVSPNSICILEHFCDNTEEKELSDYGMLLWGNLNYNYNEASMGYLGNSNFQGGISAQRTWNQPTLVTYAESHDEERLMYKNEQFGNSNASYNVKDIATGLKRQEMVAAFLLPIPGPKMIWQFGELGYDYSINRCENGTIDNSCRTSPKPIVWNYLQDVNRKALQNVYTSLIKLRTNPVYTNTFTGNDIQWDLAGAFKWMKVTGPSLRLMVVGNYDIVPVTGTVTFQHPGTWYSYLTGSTIFSTGAAQTITLQPGEYYVYIDMNVTLPLQLVSFTGSRNTNGIKLNWLTTNEENVKNFELQRSIDGSKFTTVYAGASTGNGSSQQQSYTYLDNSDVAVKAQQPLYYRLKTNDADGKSSLSKTVLIAGSKNELAVLLYPNPAAGNTLNVQMAGSLQGNTELQIQDASGRVYSRESISNTTVSGSTYQVNVSSLANGTYQLKIVSGSSVMVKPFTVQH
jgi:glycosidase